ncbi:Serine/threonine-protein kinase pim-2 [Stylophora pistillata]|uniref:Serine/threonine-protein kinase 1 n=2 Tax=Stylophora pistillata TaxID=50429 RepID=A0A2B4SEX9_STYPI|nr:Serine/threonine-protein kinase pim-2 [Stylophora pistillata]
MPKRNSRFSKKARSGQDKDRNENPKSNQNSRKRKAGTDVLPESKRKQTEKEIENFLKIQRSVCSPRLPREKSNCSGIVPQTSYLKESKDCKVSSEKVLNQASLPEEKHANIKPITSKSEQPSRKRKAKSNLLAATKRTENESRASFGKRQQESHDSGYKLSRKRSSCAEARLQGNSPQENNISKELLDYEDYEDPEEPDWLKDCHSPLWSPSYEPNYGSYVEAVKNTEPPDYIKELASSNADLAKYEIGKLLGSGSFGQVVAATRKSDNKPVALKFVNRSSVQEFKKLRGREIPAEAYLMSRVRHPNVIQIYQLIFTEEHYCFVMERPESCKDFFDVIQDRNSTGNPLSEKEVRRYFSQILEANIRCEEKGVIHRDIKPENILLDLTNDEVKLIDFGLASEIQEEPFDSFRGTNQYMPPEFMKTSKYDGCEATVWAMGILLVDMLSPVISAFEKPQHCLSMEPRIPQHFSSEVKHVVRMLLNPEADQRPTLKQVLQHPWFSMKD